jgi:hypothetical protein
VTLQIIPSLDGRQDHDSHVTPKHQGDDITPMQGSCRAVPLAGVRNRPWRVLNTSSFTRKTCKVSTADQGFEGSKVLPHVESSRSNNKYNQAASPTCAADVLHNHVCSFVVRIRAASQVRSCRPDGRIGPGAFAVPIARSRRGSTMKTHPPPALVNASNANFLHSRHKKPEASVPRRWEMHRSSRVFAVVTPPFEFQTADQPHSRAGCPGRGGNAPPWRTARRRPRPQDRS